MMMNPYNASLSAEGGPHPGYQILGVGIGGGNGLPRAMTGVGIGLSSYNGSNNNEAVSLTIGQGLAWDEWHHVAVAIDQAADEYLSVTVDGAKQFLPGVRLPRRENDGVWKRGSLIETLTATIVPLELSGMRTDDDIYWDNLTLTASARTAAARSS